MKGMKKLVWLPSALCARIAPKSIEKGRVQSRQIAHVRPLALVRRPSSKLNEGLVTHIKREPIDLELALRQWKNYCEILNKNGWTLIEVPHADCLADSVFIEDALVVFKDLAIVTRPGAESRMPEIIEVENTIATLGPASYRIERIKAPGTLDGGDVLKCGSKIFVGIGGRTNEAGFEQFKKLTEPLGADVVAVPTSLVLHLKSAVTALPDGTIIGYRPLVDDVKIFGEQKFLAVPEETGSHVVILGEKKLLMSASCPQTHRLFTLMGYEVEVCDISEYEKLEGCVTCLSVRCRPRDFGKTPESSRKIRYRAAIFHRHGHRAVAKSLAKDEIEDKNEWASLLLSTRQLKDYSVRFPITSHSSNGMPRDMATHPFGMLTRKGDEHMREKGRRLGQKFPFLRFLCPSSFRVFATNYSRTQLSASALIVGLLGRNFEKDVKEFSPAAQKNKSNW